MFVAAAALCMLMSRGAQASILIGTADGVESVAALNTLIASYNTAFTANLSLITQQLDKIEDVNGGANFIKGNLQLGNFKFYQQNGAVAIGKSQQVFDTKVDFKDSTLGLASFDALDVAVMGFERLSGPSFEYYTVKSGTKYSLWMYVSGLNPAYTDNPTGGAKWGDSLTDNERKFLPFGAGVSHISFWNLTETPPAVPEPASLAIWSVIGLVAVGGSRFMAKRRSRTAK